MAVALGSPKCRGTRAAGIAEYMERDGNGWVECSQGHRHWGKHGAAGLLLHTIDEAGTLLALLQHRADWCHHGGTWGLPGGARDSHESVHEAALREAAEETALDVSAVRTRHEFVDDHGKWSYTTVYADCDHTLDTTPNEESAELKWVPAQSIASLPLHPGFAETWGQVQLRPVTLVVDAANVVGSRPDGWWRDRAGATSKLAQRLASLRSRTVTESHGVIAEIYLVVEGQARTAAIDVPVAPVRAGGSGDDALVETVAREQTMGRTVLAVTSDRALQDRVRVTGTDVRPVSWLLTLLDEAAGSGR